MAGTDTSGEAPDGTTMDVDVVVIGAGPVGENVAARARRHGLSAAIVESWLAGGECSYYACIPSKALLRPVDVLAAARRVPGVPVGPVDVPAVARAAA
jgi:dihydrolipoamide dehydrogenase